jgi:hypothetical protein
MFTPSHWIGLFVLILSCSMPSDSTQTIALEVGPGKPFARIEDAYAQAHPGDTILVYPLPDNQPYLQVALYIDQPHITFRAASWATGQRIPLSGENFDYSGRGQVPRAIFQFNRGADGATVEGFELFGAHNESHNGAGIRINQANDVTVRHCEIHHNDMGVMSNGDHTPDTARNQLFEHCEIHHNGDETHPGFNHNLYLGGTSAFVRFCDIHSSLTGQNLKSRAHFNWIEASYIHHSANRELDLVDDDDTAQPQSHTVLIGCIVAKDPQCRGNHQVIHFGQDIGKERDGTLYLIHNTIITPFVSAVVHLSAPQARVYLVGNIIDDGGNGQKNQVLAWGREGGDPANMSGERNFFSAGFVLEGTALDLIKNHLAAGEHPSFADPAQHDYRLGRSQEGITNAGTDLTQLHIAGADRAAVPIWHYRHPLQAEERPHRGKLDLGAYEYPGD